MGAALDLDWQSIKMLCISVGIKPAAERLGITQHLDALYQRSKREQWFASVPRNEPLPATVLQPVRCVSTAPDALVASVREDVLQTRVSHARIARRAALALERKDDDELIHPEFVPSVLSLGKHAALVGGWNADSRPDAPGKAFGARRDALVVDAEFSEGELTDDPMNDPAF